jgi:transcriptional regulator with PAS, ATPase and Fis domain
MPEDPQDTPLTIELTMIRTALEQVHHDKILAAKLFGISHADLQRRMRPFGLAVDGLSEG